VETTFKRPAIRDLVSVTHLLDLHEILCRHSLKKLSVRLIFFKFFILICPRVFIDCKLHENWRSESHEFTSVLIRTYYLIRLKLSLTLKTTYARMCTQVKKNIEIHFMYLGNMEIYCNFKTCCIVCFIFHKMPFIS
jgi:hypothetical protein